MQRPLEIAFHNLRPSTAVEKLHNQRQTGNLFEVHIVLSVPGQDLAVSRQPLKARERRAHPDIHASIKDAFAAAERQLEAFKGKVRPDTSTPSGSALAGRVALIEPGTDHGFILTSAGSQLYFHRDSVTNARFEDLREGDLVHYVEEAGSSGPVATKIRVPAGREG